MKKNVTAIMRVTTVAIGIIIGFSSMIYASVSKAQKLNEVKVTISIKNENMADVLARIETSTGISFSYDKNLLGKLKASSQTYNGESLPVILKNLLKNTGFDYEIINNNIVVGKAKPAPKPQRPGRITGRVTDGKTGETLIGVSINIRGENAGTSTDSEGNFVLSYKPGTYAVSVSYIGYQTQLVEGVSIKEGMATEMNVALSPAGNALTEVVIQGNTLRTVPIKNSTEKTLIEEIRTSPGIITGISNAQISRSLDRDAAQVVRRVPGVSLLDRFILIRGLSPRYSVVQVNGLMAPSSESDQRAFSFDLLPTGVIDQISVYKSPAPELPGGFAGGVVKIKTKSTNLARRFRVGFSSQYQPGSSFTDHQTYGNGSSKDWLAAGANDRKWSDPILNDMNARFPSFNLYPQENVGLAKSLGYSALKNQYHNLDKRAELEYYDSWKIGKMRLNNLTSAYYTNARDFNGIDYQYRPTFVKDANGNPEPRSPELKFVDSVFTHNVRLSAMQNLTLVINDSHKIEFNNLYNRQGRNQVYNREGFDEDQGQSEKYFQLQYRQNQYYQGQLKGEHIFGKLTAEWKAGFSDISELSPDVERFYFIKGGNSKDNNWVTGVSTAIGDDFNRTFREETKEKGYSGNIDLTYQFNDRLKLLVGGLYQQTNRSFSLMGYTTLATANTDPALDNLLHPTPWTVIDTLLGPSRFRTDGKGYIITKFSPNQFASYKFEDKIGAGYLALNYKLLNEKLIVHAGVRFEQNKRSFFNFDGTPKEGITVVDPTVPGGSIDLPAPGIDNNFWLPSINLTYNLTDKQAVRLSYGKTIDRPDYREQAYFNFYNYEMRSNVQGNPYLKIAEIDNYDLRWELYPNEGEFLAIGGFYKRFKNAIETYDATAPGWVGSLISYENTRKADVYGIELEFRRSLQFLSPVVKDFSVIINAALTKSSVGFNERSWNGRYISDGLSNPDRPMVGTSPYIVNAALFYDNKKSGSQASLIYNIIGPRLRQAASYTNPDQYELQRHLIDLVYTQRINRWISVKAGVQDLLNQAIRLYRDDDLSGNYNPGTPKLVERRDASGSYLFSDYIESSYRPGSYYSLGINFTF